MNANIETLVAEFADFLKVRATAPATVTVRRDEYFAAVARAQNAALSLYSVLGRVAQEVDEGTRGKIANGLHETMAGLITLRNLPTK